jgi:hypothetical protein
VSRDPGRRGPHGRGARGGERRRRRDDVRAPGGRRLQPGDPNELFFVTTGSSSGADDGVNELRRLYSLRLHPRNPLTPAALTIVYNADTVVASGGDIAISPDNIDASGQSLMINEDGTTESRAVMAAKGRDGSIWRFDSEAGLVGAVGVNVSTATRVAQLDPPGRDGIAGRPGGLGDERHYRHVRPVRVRHVALRRPGAPPTTAPGGSSVTVEDGQLFLMTPAD